MKTPLIDKFERAITYYIESENFEKACEVQKNLIAYLKKENDLVFQLWTGDTEVQE